MARFRCDICKVFEYDTERGDSVSGVKPGTELENFLCVSNRELMDFARMTGNDDVHGLSVSDLCTDSREMSEHTAIEHV